jgi:hypothetical protein
MQHQQQRSEMEMAPERDATHEHAGRHVLQPGLLQVVTWQMPVMFLTSATICMIVGLFLHIWSATPHVGRMGTWDDDSKVRTSTVYSLLQPTVTAKGRLEGCQYERDGVMEQETLSLSGHWRAVLMLCVLIGRGYVHGCRAGRYCAVLCRSSCAIFAYSQVVNLLSPGLPFLPNHDLRLLVPEIIQNLFASQFHFHRDIQIKLGHRIFSRIRFHSDFCILLPIDHHPIVFIRCRAIHPETLDPNFLAILLERFSELHHHLL